jgi:hypothetical protein
LPNSKSQQTKCDIKPRRIPLKTLKTLFLTAVLATFFSCSTAPDYKVENALVLFEYGMLSEDFPIMAWSITTTNIFKRPRLVFSFTNSPRRGCLWNARYTTSITREAVSGPLPSARATRRTGSIPGRRADPWGCGSTNRSTGKLPGKVTAWYPLSITGTEGWNWNRGFRYLEGRLINQFYRQHWNDGDFSEISQRLVYEEDRLKALERTLGDGSTVRNKLVFDERETCRKKWLTWANPCSSSSMNLGKKETASPTWPTYTFPKSIDRIK